MQAFLKMNILALMLGFSSLGNATEILDVDFDLAKVPKAPVHGKTTPIYGQSITINTRDQQSCILVREELKKTNPISKFHNLCELDSERPYSTVMIFSDSPFSETQTYKKIMDVDGRHANNTRNVLLLGAAGIARYMIGEIPEQWRNPEGKSTGKRWGDNLKAGPHFDNDGWTTNYIEHPIAGSIWYSLARHSGFSTLESFGFSVFSSTFIWEYGYENVFERASINDIIITPIVGSVLGELFFQIDKSIQANDGRVMGSPFLGTTIRLITNPGYYLSQGFNKVLGAEWFDSGEMSLAVQKRHGSQIMGPQPSSNALLVNLKLRFKR